MLQAAWPQASLELTGLESSCFGLSSLWIAGNMRSSRNGKCIRNEVYVEWNGYVND